MGKSRKSLIFSLVGLVLIAGAAVWYLKFFRHRNDVSSRNSNEPTATINYSPAGNNDVAGINSSKSTPSEQTPTPTPIPEDIGITITRAVQSGSSIVIRSLLDRSVNGTCTLVLKNDISQINRTSSATTLQNQPICGNFDIATSEFSNSGTWTGSLSVLSSDGHSGKADISLEVSK